MGRKNDLTQCTRKRKEGHEFCDGHIKNLPNGKGMIGACFNKKERKRGRKRKNLLDNENENGILTTKNILGSVYLVDSKNVVYTFREDKPVMGCIMSQIY